jgi:hypothetical protein
MKGNGTIFYLIQYLPWVVCLDLAPFRIVTVILVVWAVTFLQPVLLEQVGTISPPPTMRNWAMQEIWEVLQKVSVPLLPTAERF